MPSMNRQTGAAVTPKLAVKPGIVKPKIPGRGASVIDRIGEMYFDEDVGKHMMFYGESGTGKTTVWATFPAPILAIICSGGKKPGELRSVYTEANKKRIFPVTIQKSDELFQLIDYQANTNKYKTVVLDHVTGFQDKVLAEILGLEELPEQKSWGMATRDQYGQASARCKTMFSRMLDLPSNVIMIGQERHDDPKENSEVVTPNIGIAAMPSLAQWLNPAVDYICQTFKRKKVREVETKVGGKVVKSTVETNEVEYCMRTGPDPVYTTKFRKPKEYDLPYIIVDPDYNKLMEVIKGFKQPK